VRAAEEELVVEAVPAFQVEEHIRRRPRRRPRHVAPTVAGRRTTGHRAAACYPGSRWIPCRSCVGASVVTTTTTTHGREEAATSCPGRARKKLRDVLLAVDEEDAIREDVGWCYFLVSLFELELDLHVRLSIWGAVSEGLVLVTCRGHRAWRAWAGLDHARPVLPSTTTCASCGMASWEYGVRIGRGALLFNQ
jgi:hypothetical protein